jgi:hypothetical protein
MYSSLCMRMFSFMWFLLCVGLTGHNILIAVALIPANPISIRYANESLIYSNYVAPQGWFFFTPVPTKSHVIMVRYGNRADSLGEYQDPFFEDIKRHRSNPFNMAEKAVYIHMDFPKDLALALEKGRKEKPENAFFVFEEGPISERLNNFVRYFSNKAPFMQWKLVELDTIPFSQRSFNANLISKTLFESAVIGI